jgi:DNA-binding transcriptional LysR family regulator
VNLVAMEIFVRAAEARSLSAAARRLGVSKSAISKHISQIEHELGVCLLHRTTRSVTLTEIGDAFFARCRDMLKAAEEAESVAMHFQAAPRGMLRVHAPVDFGVHHLTPALPRLLAAYPELKVDLTLDDDPTGLAEEGFDVAIVIEDEPSGGLAARRLAPIGRSVCASPDYLRRAGVPRAPRELAVHDCLVFAPHGELRPWCFEEAGVEVRVPVDGRVRLSNQNAIRQAALAGLGIALLPTYLVGADLACGALEAVLTDCATSPLAIWAVYLRNRHLSPKVRAFIDFLLDHFHHGDAAAAAMATPGARVGLAPAQAIL